MLSIKRLWTSPAQAALDADTKFVEKGVWNAWIRKDVSKKFLKVRAPFGKSNYLSVIQHSNSFCYKALLIVFRWLTVLKSKGLSHEYLSQHGLVFEDNGDPSTFEWTAKDEMQRTCKVSFATDRNHVLVQVNFEDEEEMYPVLISPKEFDPFNLEMLFSF